MADHPLRAALAWPIVLGVGLLICVLGVFALLGFLVFLATLADADIEADLDDEEYAADVH